MSDEVPPDPSDRPDPSDGPDPSDSMDALELALHPAAFRIADTSVLVGVKATDSGPELMDTEVDGTPCAVAYTDAEEIRRDLPEEYRLFRLTVPALLRRLPPEYGLLVGPHAASPLTVMPFERAAVLAADRPFPPGAPIRFEEHGPPHAALMKAVLPRLEAVAGLRRVYLTRYQVADAREKLLVVHESDPKVAGEAGEAGEEGEDAAGTAVADAFADAAAETGLDDPLRVVALGDVPEPFHDMLLTGVPPAYTGPDPA